MNYEFTESVSLTKDLHCHKNPLWVIPLKNPGNAKQIIVVLYTIGPEVFRQGKILKDINFENNPFTLIRRYSPNIIRCFHTVMLT